MTSQRWVYSRSFALILGSAPSWFSPRWRAYVPRASAKARANRAGSFSRRQQSAKDARGLLHHISSRVSKTGTSVRKVASLRKSKTSPHELNKEIDKESALRIDGCHCRQSLGMSSR